MEPSSVVALLSRVNQFGTREVCCTTRRNEPENLSLPGGGIKPGEDPVIALVRECGEELGRGLRILALRFVYERVDPVDQKVAWVFEITQWEGEPQQNEEGIGVSWQKPERLLWEGCTFREYNRGLFKAVGLIP
jgi:8-oxo-dGTP pyrophosphatase MutT (NUDIX family)